MVTGLIIGILYVFLSSIASLLTNAAIKGTLIIVNPDLLAMSNADGSPGNVLKVLDDVFAGFLTSSTKTTGGATLVIGQTIMTTAYILIIFIVVIQTLSSMARSIQGEDAENPLKIVLRGVFTIILEFVIFGNPFRSTNSTLFYNKGLLGQMGTFFAGILAPFSNVLTQTMTNDLGLGNWTINLQPAENIILCVLAFAVFKGVLEAGIVFVERWLTFAMSVLFGPIAVATNASRETSDSFKKWMSSLLGQILTIFISLLIFNMFLGTMGPAFKKMGEVTKMGSNIIFSYVISIVILALYKNSEKFLNSFGISTVANGNAFADVAAGIRAAKELTRGAIRTGRGIDRERARSRSRQNGGDKRPQIQTSTPESYKQFQSSGSVNKQPQTKNINAAPISKVNPAAFHNATSNEASGRLQAAFKGTEGKAVSTSDVMQALGPKDTSEINSKYKDFSPVSKTFATAEGNQGVLMSAKDKSTGKDVTLAMSMGTQDKLDRGSTITTITSDNTPATYQLDGGSAIHLNDGASSSFLQEVRPVSMLSEADFNNSAELINRHGSYEQYTNSVNNDIQACQEITNYLNGSGDAIKTWKAAGVDVSSSVEQHIANENYYLDNVQVATIDKINSYSDSFTTTSSVNDDEMAAAMGIKKRSRKKDKE